tara:strand:- start:516 stop:1355 length:840 start_codon:yes stop_codon:yes gene_type:complete
MEIKNFIPNKFKLLIKKVFFKKGPNIKKLYPTFVPRGKGTSEQLKVITIEAINNIFPSINELSEHFTPKRLKIKEINNLELTDIEKQNANKLEEMFTYFGSDKSTKHNYHFVYGKLISNPKKILKILEIGIGTNNIDVLGNMGLNAKPGSSLKAFKEVCKNASIYGADIDERILFDEDRIQTLKVDQLSKKSLLNLKLKFGVEFDLIIDDGLHAAIANVNTLGLVLDLIKKGGFAVVEDIHFETLEIWKLIYNLIPENKFEANMYIDKSGSYLFTIKKL